MLHMIKPSILALLCSLACAACFAEPIKVPTETFFKNWPNVRSHPGHYPFISHLTFRNICDHIIDQSTDYFDPDVVLQGDTIYINIWCLEWFVKNIHDQIKHPYILVTCDVGGWLPHPNIKKLLYDPKLAAWFCRNIVFSHHPKLFQLPMGQDLALFLLDPATVNDLLNAVAKKPFFKEHLLYMNHYPRPHGDRQKVVNLLEHAPFCFSRNSSSSTWQGSDRPQFYSDLAASKFVLSPLGLETDCVRTWEALVLDCIPIVEHTFLDPIYEGMPVVKVHTWEEVALAFLEKKYAELKDVKSEKIYFDYWNRLIKETQAKVKRDAFALSQLEATLFKPQELDNLYAILNQEGVDSSSLIYKGFLATLRPFQVANSFFSLSNLYLFDPWMDREIFYGIDQYLADKSLMASRGKISLLRSEDQFNSSLLLQGKKPYPVFLDLTYYRTSLAINFRNSVIEDGNFRHSLKRDLVDLYKKVNPNSLICGNCYADEYVREVLEMFSKENKIKVNEREGFWFFRTPDVDRTPHFSKIFQNLTVRTFLAIGAHDSTRFLLDSCNKVVTVEFVTPGYGPDAIKKELSRFNEYSNWVPIVFFSDYAGDRSWAPYKYIGSEHVFKACAHQCATHQNYALINNFYLTELNSFFTTLVKCHKIDVAFIGPPGMYLRGDMVQLLFNNVPIIVAGDIGSRKTRDSQVDVYGYSRIVPPENYEELFLPRQSAVIWVVKNEKYQKVLEALKKLADEENH